MIGSFRLIYDLLMDFGTSVLTLLDLVGTRIFAYLDFRSFDRRKRTSLNNGHPVDPAMNPDPNRIAA